MKHLIGKQVIRTGPTQRNGQDYDFSYRSTPIRILDVKDDHFYYTTQHIYYTEQGVTGCMGKEWMDGKWAEYNPNPCGEISLDIETRGLNEGIDFVPVTVEIAKHTCNCEIRDVMTYGCQCGGV